MPRRGKSPGWGDAPFEYWRRSRQFRQDAYRPLTELLLRAGEIWPGLRILDVGCGTGSPALEEAKLVGPTGTVVGVDTSELSLDVAGRFATEEVVLNAKFVWASASELPFPDGEFARVTSRFGPMYFDDLGGALEEAHRVLTPGGRLAWLVWGPFERQPYVLAGAEPMLARAGLRNLPPEAAQPFRFGRGVTLRSAAEHSGFLRVRLEGYRLPFVWPTTARQLRDHWWELLTPPFRPLAERLSSSQREQAKAETLQRLQAFESDGAVRLTTSVRLLTATKAE